MEWWATHIPTFHHSRGEKKGLEILRQLNKEERRWTISKDLIEIVGEKNVKTDQIERLCYSRDMSVHEGIPDAIVFAKTTDEVSKILKLANDHEIKVTPQGFRNEYNRSSPRLLWWHHPRCEPDE